MMNPKRKRFIAGAIAVIMILAMIVPMVAEYLLW